MLIALVLFNVVHPGKMMAGKQSDIPSRKQRKQLGINSKCDVEHGNLSSEMKPSSAAIV